MRGNEFIRRIQKQAKAAGIAFEWRPDREMARTGSSFSETGAR